MRLILLKEDGTKVPFKNSAKGISDFIVSLNLLFHDLGINIRIYFDE